MRTFQILFFSFLHSHHFLFGFTGELQITILIKFCPILWFINTDDFLSCYYALNSNSHPSWKEMKRQAKAEICWFWIGTDLVCQMDLFFKIRYCFLLTLNCLLLWVWSVTWQVTIQTFITAYNRYSPNQTYFRGLLPFLLIFF